MQIGWDGFAWMWGTQLCDSTLTLSSCVHSHYQDELWTWTNLCFSSCVSHCGGCTQCLVSVKTQHCHTATFNLHVGLITSRTAVKRAIIWLSSRGQSGSITPSVHDCWADLMLALCQFSTKNLVSCLHFKPAGHWHSQPGRSTEQMKSNIYVLHINHRLFRKKSLNDTWKWWISLLWDSFDPSTSTLTRKWLQCSVDLKGPCGAAPPFKQRAAVRHLGNLLPSQTDEVFLEAQIQNITTSPMFMEKVSLEPSMMYNVTELNTVTSEGDR